MFGRSLNLRLKHLQAVRFVRKVWEKKISRKIFCRKLIIIINFSKKASFSWNHTDGKPAKEIFRDRLFCQNIFFYTSLRNQEAWYIPNFEQKRCTLHSPTNEKTARHVF